MSMVVELEIVIPHYAIIYYSSTNTIKILRVESMNSIVDNNIQCHHNKNNNYHNVFYNDIVQLYEIKIVSITTTNKLNYDKLL